MALPRGGKVNSTQAACAHQQRCKPTVDLAAMGSLTAASSTCSDSSQQTFSGWLVGLAEDDTAACRDCTSHNRWRSHRAFPSHHCAPCASSAAGPTPLSSGSSQHASPARQDCCGRQPMGWLGCWRGRAGRRAGRPG